MPIRVTCPWCGKKLKAPDALAGKGAKCPACGSRIAVPDKPADSSADLGDADPFDGELTWESAQIKFTCHGCKGVFEIDAAREGQQTVCSACGTHLIVPSDGQVSKPVVQTTPAQSRKPASTSKTTAYHRFKAGQRLRRKQVVFVSMLLGAGALFLLMVTAIKFASDRESKSAGRREDRANQPKGQARPAQTDPKDRKDMPPDPKPSTSMLDGSVACVKAFIREHAHDPKSVEFDKWSGVGVGGIVLPTDMQNIRVEYFWAVKVRYRCKNQFGAKEVNTQVFMIRNGKAAPAQEGVGGWELPNDFY